MVNIARNHACSCTYYTSGAPSVPLGGPRLWARENHGTRPVEGQQPSQAVFEIINDWYSEGTNYQFMIWEWQVMEDVQETTSVSITCM